MFRKRWWLTAALIVIAALAGGVASSGISFLVQEAQAQRNTAAVKPPVRKWEYQVYVAPGPKDLADKANQLGDEGWELTGIITDERVIIRYIGYFKRSKQ
jgi:hypothetical protein